MAWYIVANGAQQGPLETSELSARHISPDTLVWKEGMADWQRADSIAELRPLFDSPRQQYVPPPPHAGYPPAGPQYQPRHPAGSSNRIAAGVLGIILGSLGVHKFILGYTGAGLVMLLVTILTCGLGGAVMSIIGIVEGIIYLTKSEEEFYREYVLQQRPWF